MAKQTFTTGQVLTAAQMTSLQQTAMGGGSTTAKTASYVLVAADAGTVVQMNSASATTITVNTALFAAGDTVQIQNVGAGVCTVTAGTATVSTSSVLTLQQYDAGSLYFNSTSAAIFFASDAANSPLTTKGDLFTYSTSDTRLPVGNNGESLYADSAATAGLRYSATPSASNPVLNSAMQVWQRGTSISLSASSGAIFTADRWTFATNASQACTVSRQVTGDTTNLPNIQYCARIQRNSGQTGTGTLHFVQSFESVNSIPFAGKTVTMSFYARKGANYSPTSNALIVYLMGGTGTDQNRGGGTAYTGETYIVNNQTATLTATWQRFTYTGTVGATVTEMAPYFDIVPTGTAGVDDYFEITGVQIDIGSVALPFRTNQPTFATELAACQRYYFRTTGGEVFANGIFFSGTKARIALNCPVTMRTDTGAIDYNNLWLADGSASTYNVTAVGYYYYGKQVKLLEIDVASGGTASRPVYLSANAGSSASYIGATAEL